jgi:hypothetical protein
MRRCVPGLNGLQDRLRPFLAEGTPFVFWWKRRELKQPLSDPDQVAGLIKNSLMPSGLRCGGYFQVADRSIV